MDSKYEKERWEPWLNREIKKRLSSLKQAQGSTTKPKIDNIYINVSDNQGIYSYTLLCRIVFHPYDYAEFSITGLAGCGKTVVFHDVAVAEKLRGKGYGKILHALRLDFARKWGFESAICTVSKSNEIERHILTSFGWNELLNEDLPYTLWQKIL